MTKIKPDRKGGLALPEMSVQIFTRQDHIRLVDMGTGEPLRDMDAEQQLRRAAERQAEIERQARLQAEARFRELEEKLRKAGLE